MHWTLAFTASSKRTKTNPTSPAGIAYEIVDVMAGNKPVTLDATPKILKVLELRRN